MANIDKILAKGRQYENQKVDFQKKVLQLGDNRFRIVGDVKFVYEHWFISADGVPVHSMCNKDENGKGKCSICEKYEEAFNIINTAGSTDGLTEDQILNAKIIIGIEIHKNSKFASSWKAREYAYMNVIDKDDNWCRDNKHSKILCKSNSQAGVSSGKGGIFNEIIDVIDENGDYEKNNYDIRIKKSGRNMDTLYRGYVDKENELTLEEKQYEIYGLDSITTPTSEEVLNKWLTIGVKTKDNNESEVSNKEKTKIVTTVKTKEVKETEEVKPKTLKAKTKIVETTLEPTPPPIVEEELAECPNCGKEISITSDKCKFCLTEFVSDTNVDI